ncbi:MAG: SDR family NAD(P)-dependent oxidoreductase [Spirochaetia bacterium]
MATSETKPWALITGASSGIGYAIAKKLDEKGYQTVLVARRADRLKELQQLLQNHSEICIADLRENSQVIGVFEFCESKKIILDLLVNNAGFGHNGEFKDEPLSIAQEMVQVNITALVTLSKLFLPQMLAQKHGRIVQISSAASFFAGPLMANYYATKAYVTSFSRALNYEVSPYGLGVTIVCPGPVKTEFGQVAKAGSSRILKKKVTTAQDIAQFTYHAICKKRVMAIHGGAINVMIILSRILPSSLVIRLTALLNKTKPKLDLEGKEFS